jgi:hypothetical protein
MEAVDAQQKILTNDQVKAAKQTQALMRLVRLLHSIPAELGARGEGS